MIKMTTRECTRCGSDRVAGGQCSRRTCLYAKRCWQHTKKTEKLQIKPSKIQGAGKGLITTKKRKKGEKIADYDGDNISKAQYNQTDSGYGLEIPGGRVIDAHSTQSCLGRWANNCRKRNKDKGECTGNNAKLTYSTRTRKAGVKATKTLQPGEEVFVSYGRGYWKNN